MPDGMKRARRNGSKGEARKRWYAHHRSVRFSRRFGLNTETRKVEK